MYGLSPGALTLLASFLTDRKPTVHVNASTSDVRSLKYGVPQGSVLGPLLFSSYINDLPLFIKACFELFVEDATIHSSNSNLRKAVGITTEEYQQSVKNGQSLIICLSILIKPTLCLYQPGKRDKISF